MLTEEQQRVVQHAGGHARVLAVAGSGKTTTLVHRCRHLIDEVGINPRQVRVLMFNRRAREQFEHRLQDVGAGRPAPLVSTFHAFSYRFITEAMNAGHCEKQQLLTGDEQERARLLCHRAIDTLERRGDIPAEEIDVEQALSAIGLWKSALIEPVNAGHRYNPHLPLVYEQFETMRREKKYVTYDDFVPLTVSLLQDIDELRRTWTGRCSNLIVDEYQDVNFGQQVLLELLAGDCADVMVVGDDDQTIYEWRGARPSYILRDFFKSFSSEKQTTYRLSRSFRFGPVLAQAAQNVIQHNENRAKKSVIAHNVRTPTEVHLHEHAPGRESDANGAVAEHLIRLVREDGVAPTEIWVLGRSYAQLSTVEPQLLSHKVPYRVLGARPVFERPEVDKLFQYIDVGARLDDPVDAATAAALLSILNVPNRMITRALIDQALRGAQQRGGTLHWALAQVLEDPQSTMSRDPKESLEQLVRALSDLQSRLEEPAGAVLASVVDEVRYLDHFRDYYGQGEHSADRTAIVGQIIHYAASTRLNVVDFIAHARSFDTTRGLADDELVTLTTIHKTKGLEFDHVVIPACYEGFMPMLLDAELATYDKSGVATESELSFPLESERRLFYVGLTRAMRSVHIITSRYDAKNQEQLPSRFLEEVELGLTQRIMGTLTDITDGATQTDAEGWLTAVDAGAGRKDLIQNLMSHLQELGAEDLLIDVTKRTAAVPEAPFTYERQYPAPGSHSPEVASEEPPKRMWGHMDAE